ncbi:MAG: von Willebrand factor type A domain-containing protein [Actinomycetota bacterium]
MNHRSMNTYIAALVAAGLVVGACASDDDSDAAEVSPDAEAEFDSGDDASEAVDDSGRAGAPADGEADFADPPSTSPASASGDESDDAMDEEEAMDEEAMDEEESSASDDAAADGADRAETDASGDEASDGGLFDEPSTVSGEDAEADARFEDNRFEDYGYRDFIDADDDPLSTFALDVDTGSYSIARRWIEEGSLPPRESVRPEEYVNAFDYRYDTPRRGLEISVDGGPSPFDDDNVLVRVGVQGEIVADEDRGDAALTFVIDTSGSMDRDDRLGLVKESLDILVEELEEDDTVAIVTYSDSSGVVLEPTPVSERNAILDAIDDLGPGGSTNLEAGLRTGYDLAREAFDDGGINRVVLASDGVANVGMTDPDALAAMIREDADRGIDLVTVGFGMGNFSDVTMEQLADNGDGFYAYVDTEDEAERLFEDELTSTLLTVAKDAKIQVEFDPDVVESYRLIGFENRGVLDSDFRNDDVDAGELGAGHQVTAIYEVELERGVDLDDRDEIGEVFLRWEHPETGEVSEIDEDIDLRDVEPNWGDTDIDFQLATTVATLAEKLRDNPFADDVDLDAVVEELDRLADEYDTPEVDELADLADRAAELT